MRAPKRLWAGGFDWLLVLDTERGNERRGSLGNPKGSSGHRVSTRPFFIESEPQSWTNEQAGIRRERGYGGIPLVPFPISNLVKVHLGGIFPYPRFPRYPCQLVSLTKDLQATECQQGRFDKVLASNLLYSAKGHTMASFAMAHAFPAQ